MTESTQAIAARCLADPAYARQVLDGDAHPEVRAAIIADLEWEEVQGFLNPQPEPPSRSSFVPPAGWLMQQWLKLPRRNLQELAAPKGGG